MNNTSVIQVRLREDLREAAERRASELGLSSVQEAIRLFLHGFTTRKVGLGVTVEAEEVKLSAKAKKRWAEMEADLNAKRNVEEFDDPKEAMSWLNSQSR